MVAEVQPQSPDSEVSGEESQEPVSAAVDAESTPEPAGTDSGPEDFDDSEILAGLDSEGQPDSPAAPDMPGQTHQEALRANQEAWIRSFGQIYQGNENDVVHYLESELGITSSEARNAWHQKLRPLFQALGNAGGEFFTRNFNSWIDYTLTPSQKDAFRGQGDKARIYRNEGEYIKGLLALGANDRQSELTKAGWMSKEQAVKYARRYHQQMLKRDGVDSGNEINGYTPSRGSKFYSEMTAEERGKLTAEERDAAVQREAAARSRR
jgi:hypothetical protein